MLHKLIKLFTTPSSGSRVISDGQKTQTLLDRKMHVLPTSNQHPTAHSVHVTHAELMKEMQRKQTELYERLGETASDVKNLRRNMTDSYGQLDGKLSMLAQDMTELRHDMRALSDSHTSFYSVAEKRLVDLESSRLYLLGVMRSIRIIGSIVATAIVAASGVVIRWVLNNGL